MHKESPIARSAPGVFITSDPIVCLGMDAVERVKMEARHAPRKRARINAHPDANSPVQEMLIALDQETYLRPHRHHGKSESFHVIEGLADVVMLDEEGEITDVIKLGPPGGARCFYYRQAEARFHTLIIRTPYFVMHETTNGPFAPEFTTYAPWAPEEGSPEASNYMRALRERVDRLSAC